MTTVRPYERRAWQGWVLGLAIASAAGVALGQVAPNYNQNGHLLDKNNQVGSGGSNSPVSGFVPATGNEIITNNVNGLSGFHGNVPYSSQYEFGTIGANDSVGRFNRQSAGSPSGSTYTGGVQSYYDPARIVASPATLAPAGVRVTGVGSGVDVTAARNNAYGGRLNVQPIGAPIALVPSGSFVNTPQEMERLNQNTSNSFDNDNQVSGLFGLRQNLRADAPENRFQNLRPSESTTVNPAAPVNNLIDGQQPGATNNLNNGTNGANNQIRTDIGVHQQIDNTITGGVTSTKVDERLRGAVASALVGQTNKDDLVSDEYRDLLSQLQKSREADQARQLAAAPKTKPSTGPEFVIDPLTGQLRVRGVDDKGNPLAGAATQPGKRGIETTRDASSALKAARNMPPLDTLAGRAGTPFNALMAGAEVRLKNGKYFEAASLYQEAMAQQPTNMLPVIGRAHAELGGGMYESAAYDLKFMFERKPEMMGLRYNLKSLIPQDRLDYLVKDLKSLAEGKKSETSWFLLSYLQYQQGQKDALDLSLTAWAAALPKDAWPAAMRRAWVDAKPEEAKPAEEKKVAPGADQPQTR